MNKLDEFTQVHEEALQTIKDKLEPSQYEPDTSPLFKWMLETDANPYAYLPEGWAGHMSTATGCASLFHMIDHAVHDDGDITFVKVNGEPRIVFAWRHEDNFRDMVLSFQEKDLEARRVGRTRFKYEVEILDIKPAEFGPLYDAYQAERVKEYFINDAWSRGVDWAADHYRKYNCWDESWIEDARKELGE